MICGCTRWRLLRRRRIGEGTRTLEQQSRAFRRRCGSGMNVESSKLKRMYAPGFAVFLVLLLAVVWEIVAQRSSSARFFYSSPLEIFSAFVSGVYSGQTIDDLVASGKATLAGLLIGLLCGSMIGVIALTLPRLNSTIRTLTFVLSALPILAVAPMFLIWFGTGLSLKIALATILSALIFAGRTAEIRSAVGPDLIGFLTINSVPPGVQTRKVLMPVGVEWMVGAFPQATNAAFLGVFVGEFVAADRGIGYRILRSGALYQVDVVLAQTVTALLLLGAFQFAVYALRALIINFVQSVSLDRIYLSGHSIKPPSNSA